MKMRVCEIWLSLACTPDTATFPRLLEHFNNPFDIYNASDDEIRSAVGANTSDCSRLLDKDLTRAEQIYEFCQTKSVGLLSYFDDAFPQSLRDIPTPPVLLYFRGRLPNFKKRFRCAVVGTRSLSDYGRINAFNFAYDMAKAGAIIISGMAKGIDGVALAGALAGGAQTIAVIGSGIDVCYPSEHRRLAQEIVKEGCVFTEYPPGTKPDRQNFPRRNRLISGLARVTVVVEGRENSGSLITARHAKKQGRPVYAFPGNVGNEGSQVTNLLIKNGAILCTGADDIVLAYERETGNCLNPFNLPIVRDVNMKKVIEDLQVCAITYSDDLCYTPDARSAKVPKSRSKMPKEAPSISRADAKKSIGAPDDADAAPEGMPTFDAEALRIYKKLPFSGDCTIDSLIDENTDIGAINTALLKLEMTKFIVRLPGGRVRRNYK